MTPPPLFAALSGPLRSAHEGRFTGLHIWFTGIGGSGMSGLATMLHERGAECSGSDRSASAATSHLEEHGISVTFDQEHGRLPEACDLLVASAAIPPDHPELLAAQRRSIPVLTYAEALGLAQVGRTTVCIAGTHGKSTTTAMLGWVCIEAGLDPSVIVGAHCPQIGGGSRTGAEAIPTGPRAGEPGVLVAEACEFSRSFHHHKPVLALINNIEEDHLDCYGSLDEIVKSFRRFAQLLPAAGPDGSGGHLLIGHDGAHRREVAADLPCRVSTFGWDPSADYVVSFERTTRMAQLRRDGVTLLEWRSPMPGEHNALNGAAAGILALWLGGDPRRIESALTSFGGLDRRSQKVGERLLPDGSRVRVYDDYGHHPTECEKTLKAIRDHEKPTRLICVFQPHQHSRTRFLLEQFAQSFSAADLVIVPPIYFVRDTELERTRVAAEDLVERLRARGVHAIHLNPFEAIVEHLEVVCREGDLVVVMGAGPVGQVAYDFVAGAEAPST